MLFAIVLNYKNYKQTKKCVENLRLGCIDHIVVVDNSSPNDSFEKLNLAGWSSRDVSVIQTSSNKGYAAGNNYGLQYINRNFPNSDNSIIFIVNPDVIADVQCMDLIADTILSKKNVGAVTAKVNNTMRSAWHHMSLQNVFFYNSWIFRWIANRLGFREGGYYTEDSNKNTIPVDVVTGAFFGIKQSTINRIQGFDEGTFLYYEEEALYARLKNIDCQNYMVTNGTFYHKGRGSTSLSKVSFKRINDASRLYVLQKYYNAGKIYSAWTQLINKLDNILLVIFRR